MHAERVSKVLARAGLCSRRKAEKLILTGRVTVNGQTLTTPATKITLQDVLSVDGKTFTTFPMPTRLWRYHKPRGLVVTHHDPQGRQTVFATLPASLPRVVSIGRLDITSEGLLLLTNDGSFARQLELPENRWVRRYRVRIHGKIDTFSLERLSHKNIINNVIYAPIHVQIDNLQGSHAWLTVSLREGRNREIRRVMEAYGWSVSRLIRIDYGPFQLGSLAERAVEEIPSNVLLKKMLPTNVLLKKKCCRGCRG